MKRLFGQLDDRLREAEAARPGDAERTTAPQY